MDSHHTLTSGSSGARDGAVLIWDLRNHTRWSARRQRYTLDPAARIDVADSTKGAGGATSSSGGAARMAAPRGTQLRRSVTALAFLPGGNSIAAGGDMDGVVRIWDARMLSRGPSGLLFAPLSGVGAAGVGGASPSGGFSTPLARGRAGGGGKRGTPGSGGRGSGGKGRGAGAGTGGLQPWMRVTCPQRGARPHGITSLALAPAGAVWSVLGRWVGHAWLRAARGSQPSIFTVTTTTISSIRSSSITHHITQAMTICESPITPPTHTHDTRMRKHMGFPTPHSPDAQMGPLPPPRTHTWSSCTPTPHATCPFPTHPGDMLLVSCSDGGHHLYPTASLDRGAPWATLSGHRATSFCVKSAFSADGRQVVSGSSDGVVHIWNVSSEGRGGGGGKGVAASRQHWRAGCEHALC